MSGTHLISRLSFNIYKQIDLFGLYLLYGLLILNPFHFLLFDTLPFYRDCFSVLFLILVSIKLFDYDKKFSLKQIPIELTYFILFFIILGLFALVDPGIDLYDSDYSGASLYLNVINPTLYVLRNAFIYIPMVIYFAIRGLTEGEIRKIAFVIIMVAPISILTYIYHEKMATITTLFILAKLEGVYFNYNSYIPYLTFPIVSAFYLLATDTNKIIKLISFSALIIVSDYVLLSYSRQSFLFTIGCGFVFLSLNKEIVFFKKILFISIYIICVLISMKQLTKESNTDKLIQRYSIGNEYATESATDSFKNHPLVQNRSYRNKLKRNHTIKRVERVFNTTRLDIALDGIALLKPTEIITGVGLSSVVNSGPHNDYIRWMQRVGVLVMLVGFSPFFIAGWGAFCRSYQERKNGLQIYLFLAVCFTLFHSVFGYPREDAYQAVYCFLGLAMWLGISNKGGVLRRRQEPIKDNYVALLNQYAKE